MADPLDFATSAATACKLPEHSGDGYGYGGGAVVVIANRAIPIGEGYASHQLAEEIARRWNAALAAEKGEG